MPKAHTGPLRTTTAIPYFASAGGMVEAYAGYVRDLVPLHALHQSVRALATKARPADAEQQQTGAAYKMLWVRLVRGCGDYVLLGMPDALQIWDVRDLNNINEVANIPTGGLAAAQILPAPALPNDAIDPWRSQRPLVALIASGQDGAGGHGCSIYSLQSHTVVHRLAIDAVPLDVFATDRLVATVTASSIHAFDARILEPVFTISSQRAEAGPLPVALGQRWVAYADTAPANAGTRLAHDRSSVSFAKDYARELASGLYQAGGKGYATVSSYLSGPPPADPEGQPETNDTVFAGTVVVRDIRTRDLVAVFTAHRAHSISRLAFNSSGTLLATVSTQGRSFNIYSLTALPKDTPGSGRPLLAAQHLYTLTRGLTNATIQDISFSGDSRWVGFTTTHGTTHIYAICPWGGVPTPHTHVPDVIENLKVYTSAGADNLATMRKQQADTVAAVARIRPSQQALEETCVPAAVRFTGRVQLANGRGVGVHGEGLLAIDHRQILTHHILELGMHAGHVLSVAIQPLIAWNLSHPLGVPAAAEDEGRAGRVPDADGVYSAAANAPMQPTPDVDQQWLAQVELSTHFTALPLAAAPQFAFKQVVNGSAETEAVLAQAGPVHCDKHEPHPTDHRPPSSTATGGGGPSEDMLDHLASALREDIPRTAKEPVGIGLDGARGDVDLGVDVLFFHDEAVPIYPKGGTVLTIEDATNSQIWWQPTDALSEAPAEQDAPG